MQSNRPISTLHWLWLVPVLLLVIALITPQLNLNAPWLDEAYTHQYAGTGDIANISLFETILRTAQFSPWPPVYYMMQNIWGDLTGSSFFAANVLPMFLGLLAITVMYQLAKSLFSSPRTALIATTLLSTSTFFLYYFQETRGYTLYALMCLLVAVLYWRWVTTSHKRSSWLKWGFTLSVAGALYSHYVATAFIGGLFIYHLVIEWRQETRHPNMTREQWLNILRAFINGGLLFAPWLGVLILGISQEASVTRSEPLLSLTGNMLLVASNNLLIIALPLALATLFFIKERTVRFLWIWLGVSLIAIAVINLAVSFLFHPRHIIPIVPIFILLITYTLSYLRTKYEYLTIGFLGIWVGMGIAFTLTGDFITEIPNHISPMPLAMMNQIESITNSCIADEDAVIFSLDTIDYEENHAGVFDLYYYVNAPFSFSYLTALVADGDAVGKLPEALQTRPYADRVAGIVGEAPQVWVLARTDIPNTENLFALDTILEEQGYLSCGTFWQTDELNGWVYTNGDSCETIIQTCNP